LAHAALATAMPSRKIAGGKLKTCWIYRRFREMKKIRRACKNNSLFPFAHTIKFSPLCAHQIIRANLLITKTGLQENWA
jgi:hypothetical protein